jgi:hypothetical protein
MDYKKANYFFQNGNQWKSLFYTRKNKINKIKITFILQLKEENNQVIREYFLKRY